MILFANAWPATASVVRLRSLLGLRWLALLFFGVVSSSTSDALAAERPPNIIYILADDLGWTDLGCQGSEFYETPNIDRLAASGLRMLRCYNSQNCAPTRAAIMSGQYAPRTGIYTVASLERGSDAARQMDVPKNETKLPLEKITLPEMLKKAGYVTGMFGKWHLGLNGPYHPGARGFDEAIESSGRHFHFKTHPHIDYPEDQYLADFLTDRALDFINRHKETPFFLYLPHFAVHTPIHAKPEYISRWQDKAPGKQHWHPTYAAMIQSLDESVGRIMAKLDELELAESTVVIFSSDNGGLGGYQRTEPPSKKRGFTDNAPLRGGKGTLYEGGIRVPFVVRWPGIVSPGTTSEQPIAHVDIYPTFLEIAGAMPAPGYILDGISFVPVLREAKSKLSRKPLYWHFPGYLESYVHDDGWRTTPVGAIHDGEFKLMEFFETGQLELYNLTHDIGERTNLVESMPDQAKKLKAKLAAWREQTGALMPAPKQTQSAR